jgi:hypothetical protein
MHHLLRYKDITMRLKYAYILPIAYILFFLIDETLNSVILSLAPLQGLGLLGLLFQIWFFIHVIVDAPTGVILQVLSGIPDGIVSVIIISLVWYFIFGVFLDFYDTLPWRRNV